MPDSKLGKSELESAAYKGKEGFGEKNLPKLTSQLENTTIRIVLILKSHYAFCVVSIDRHSRNIVFVGKHMISIDLCMFLCFFFQVYEPLITLGFKASRFPSCAIQ